MSLQRFHEAQSSQWSGYATALEEIRAGEKSSHWIWYIFPQLAGLGRSGMAEAYALRDLAEAVEYLCDPELGAHYREIVGAVAEQLASGAGLVELMGGTTDALKLVSSLTLFRAASARAGETDTPPPDTALKEAIDTVLERAGARGFFPCTFTLSQIAAESAE